MASDGTSKGKKRSKAFYRKSAFGAKRQCTGKNILEPGIRGFLVMCHSNESSAVRESYNILNEYADLLYGPEKPTTGQNAVPEQGSESEDDCEDIEKALEKEVDGLKNITPTEKRFQNVATKAKNIVFIRTTLQDTVKVVTTVMEDIASRKLNRARYAARMLPIVGTCKAQTAAIAELAKNSLSTYLSEDNPDVPTSFTIMFKARNNNGTTCGKESVIPAVKHEILTINPKLIFSWSDYEVAVIVEIVCTNCCLSLAPGYIRLRKYNFQELANGQRIEPVVKGEDQEKSSVQEVSQTTPCEMVHKNASKDENQGHERSGAAAAKPINDEDKTEECAVDNRATLPKPATSEGDSILASPNGSGHPSFDEFQSSLPTHATSHFDDSNTETDISSASRVYASSNIVAKHTNQDQLENEVRQTPEASEALTKRQNEIS